MEKGINKIPRIIRIAITGPESTGKSELACNLAKHFNTVWVPEFAREYLEKLGRNYEYNDILEIAKGQLSLEKSWETKAKGMIFCDTELIVLKIWSEFKYNCCHQWILDHIVAHWYDLYLLCDIDLPWESDPLREHPNQRKELFKLYFHELSSRKLPFKVVKGFGKQRFDNALTIIKNHFDLY